MPTINDKINSLRNLLAEANINAFIIPSSDAHQSEYVAPYANVRQWISDFTGSAGTVIVTANHAGLWTDGRYYLQAESQLANSEIQLHKMGNKGQNAWLNWLNETLDDNATVAFDGNLFTKKQSDSIENKLRTGITLNTSFNPIPDIWEDRPGMPSTAIYEHPIEYSITSRVDKINGLRQKFTSEADAYLVSALDDIAYLFNLRGSDIDFNPIFYAFALVEKDNVILFCNEEKIPTDILSSLKSDGIEIKGYDLFIPFCNNLPNEKSIYLDPADTSIHVYRAINASKVEGRNIIRDMKGTKSEKELMHVRSAMEKDGVALLRMYRWLDEELDSRSVSEVEISDKIQYFRSIMPGYVGESFPPIVGYKDNGAIIHYKPQAETCSQVKKEGMLLIDSGGQYINGTTDITRTICYGTPTAEQKQAYTRVLKGMIAIDELIFPAGTSGYQLDILARTALWREGLDYGHGTGHGVGYLLNVHEGPQGISQVYSLKTKHPLEPGMITSNEPGYYKAGDFGIRIENLIATKEQMKTEYGVFYGHETLTLFPIATNLIHMPLLTKDEVEWMNSYHREVEKRLTPHLDKDEIDWLKEKCMAI